MLNPVKLLKLKSSWDIFVKNHPKFPSFLNAVNKNAMSEGTIIEIKVITPEGKSINSNIKLNKTDMDLFKELSENFGK